MSGPPDGQPESSPSPLVTVQGVGLAYGERPALSEFDLELPRGELTVLLGPNGAGKSTLLALLAGVLAPSTGTVRVDQRDLATLSRAEVARSVAYLPGRPETPADYRALELVLMARYPFGRGLLTDRPRDVEIAREALARVDALQFAERPAAELSSGERQRVLLARLLCQASLGAPDGTPLLLLDEPTSAQDLAHRLALFSLLRELAETHGRCVVVASHALNAAARHAHRIVVLREGRLLCAGTPGEVLTEELLREGFSVRALIGVEGGAPYAVPLEPSPPADSGTRAEA
ncbi:MAG: ABC transporter ATP-binding protein [Planctomycetes bacterium]|nr:ABC transporter ATP-binding protein [Planctomycetota bacterium]